MVHELTETGAEIEAEFLRALDPADQKELHRMLLTLLASSTQSDADGCVQALSQVRRAGR